MKKLAVSDGTFYTGYVMKVGHVCQPIAYLDADGGQVPSPVSGLDASD